MPPIKLASLSTISNVVAVPKSITIAGSLYFETAAAAFAILSAPISLLFFKFKSNFIGV